MNNSVTRNFAAALEKLEQFIGSFNGSEVERAGIIQAFEFTFEQCWKSLQKKAAGEGIVLASPKKAFEWAMSAQLIRSSEEELWINLLSDRNLTSHTYREPMALKVFENVRSRYAAAFRNLLNSFEGP